MNTLVLGKPFISHHLNQTNLQFNLSYSHNIIVIAFTLHSPIGVDLEYKSPIKNIDASAKKIFKKKEYEAFVKLGNISKIEVFYEIWVRKEAFAKTVGKGLSYPLEDIEISYISNSDYFFYNLKNHKESTNAWHFYDNSFYYINLNFACVCCVPGATKKLLKMNPTFQNDIYKYICT